MLANGLRYVVERRLGLPPSILFTINVGSEDHSQKFGYALIDPYVDGDVIASQRSLGLEIMRAVEELDAIVVLVGSDGF